MTHALKGRPSPRRGKGPGLAWLKAHVDHDGTECLIWPFSKQYQGYGQVGVNGKIKKAHNVMCQLVHGPAPTPQHQAAHNCGKGHLGCVHPKHVQWKTPAENRADTFLHGNNPTKMARRLTIDQVEEIRVGTASVVDTAKQYGVSVNAIFKIRRGETWVRPRSVITGEQFRRIRELASDGLKTSEIARAVGLKYNQVWKVRSGVTFQEIK